ncbi:MAG TPA: hypothetical protein VE172_10070, partial [Stackebrandtia sp.]|uniref:hypothetical protein n=1 Tax=Stackebrandtia sp. TaxID=2023065 RepID=UPI002D3A8ABE
MPVSSAELSIVTARAQSRDKTVRATLSQAAGLRVRLKPGSLDGHTPDSLARAVSAAVTGVLAGYRRAGDRIAARELGAGGLEGLRDSAT